MTRTLDGILVVDLTQIYNGPYATFLMAAAGAQVVKIEPPGGEPLRRRGSVGGAALPFAMLNAGKEAICLDLKAPEGKQALTELLRKADVLVENYAPGVMDRLGFGDDVLRELNPRLVRASSSGYGTDGPYRKFPAMDLTVQAITGVMEITGFADSPPVKAGPAVADITAGVHLYGAIVTALLQRERTGHAPRTEVAMQDAVYHTLGSALGMHWSQKDSEAGPPPRTGNRHAGLAEAPYNVYPTNDGYLAIICTSERHWHGLAKAMGRMELAADARFATLPNRVANIDEIDNLVASWTSAISKEEAFHILMANHVPCAPVRNLGEVMEDENMHARGALRWVDHPELGRVVLPRSPMRYDGDASYTIESSHKLGEDTASVLRRLTGLSDDAIKAIAAHCEPRG